MEDPKRLYECLLDYCSNVQVVERIGIGLVWTVCQTRHHHSIQSGLAMSPVVSTRTLKWPGTLAGRSLKELGQWLLEWDPYKATVGIAAINCSINNERTVPQGLVLNAEPGKANLTVFEHFLPSLQGKKVVVIGHYPGIERYVEIYGWMVLERSPVDGDYPDPACEFLIPEADWVFLSGSTITNKTFPRLAELSQSATTVLMGPTVPWLPELSTFGIDYLAGVEVYDPETLYRTAQEGGGMRIFEAGVRYKVVELDDEKNLAWIKKRIAETFADKERLTQSMSQWYTNGNSHRFPQYADLNDANLRLSRMDSVYKTLWDTQQKITSSTD